MKNGKWKHLLAVAVVGVSVSACVASPVAGSLYMNVKGPIAPTTATATDKQGTACASTILGLVASGDASVDAAKKKAGITEVSSVDHSSFNVLGIYGKFCSIVTGK